MEEDEKKFDLVEIVLLIIISLFNDLMLVGVDLAVAVPVVGQVLGGGMELMNALIWGLILFWFIMKMGFAAEIGLIQIAGGVAEFFGIPGRTATVGIGIWLANHPKAAKVAEVVAGVVATAATAGTAAPVATGTAVATETATGAEAAVSATEAEIETAKMAAPRVEEIRAPERETMAEKPRAAEEAGVKEAPEKPETPRAEAKLGEPPTPFEELEKLTREAVTSDENEEEESGEEIPMAA